MADRQGSAVACSASLLWTLELTCVAGTLHGEWNLCGHQQPLKALLLRWSVPVTLEGRKYLIWQSRSSFLPQS